ncbi:hypothetical protein [Desulfitobacterium sp.]|uniref:hypothetical protein n=1 Tax=Desulfitobacterium sp. TaxID=49981 RepID=UPI002BD0EAD3|nr:hypothetical protein [Desulfitobacterium sp.]HVJ48640.1 hypothetical protein [Desulfitobacterium sp.]
MFDTVSAYSNSSSQEKEIGCNPQKGHRGRNLFLIEYIVEYEQIFASCVNEVQNFRNIQKGVPKRGALVD